MTSCKSLLLLLLSLILLQALCFGPIFGHVGFYLDDWATLCILHFAPKEGGFFGLLHHYLFNDSRVLIRPLEVLHYGTLYWLFGEKPLPYHISNLAFEALNSLLFYCILIRLTGRRALSYAGALVLLLYPSHDAAHYWAIASSLILSLVFYLASLRSSIKATDLYLEGSKSKSWLFQAFSFIFFILSLYNYENFAPFLAVSALVSLALAYRQNGRIKGAILQGVITAAPLAVAMGSLLFYLKAIVPKLGKGYAHAVTVDPANVIAVLSRGLCLNAPPEALQFFVGQAQTAAAALTSTEGLRLAALVAVATASIIYCLRLDQGDPSGAGGPALLKTMDLLLLGLFTVFVSYTIFGLSYDYMPTYISMVNRINIAPSVGVALVIVALAQGLEKLAAARRHVYVMVMALGTAACTVLYTLTTWGLAKPWVVSWTTQKQVRDSVFSLKGKIDKDASVLLINCPRYVMWSPVFDGVWDFQNMVRITLEEPDFNASVVSERLSLTDKGLTDVSYGYKCGTYPFDKLYLMVAPHAELVPVRSGAEFVDIVGRRGMTFGLDKKSFSKWQEQAASESAARHPGPKLEASH